ncbi:hypothetical protein F383_32821 [Gossypium arboreum]|uniref:Neprosin PEP catalytic domain-containing protein n=1 Tax=Gossypium arboreum TaxID=29729 RepID=A0A0B0N0Z2_GOSAR|nr:hypothetical protein F383_32821 [Gossypium arboreum]
MVSCCCKIPIFVFIFLLLVISSSICATHSSETGNSQANNQTFRPEEESKKLKLVRERLNKINKPALKTIQAINLICLTCRSPLFAFYCVLLRHQPAFDHPKLKGKKPLDPPESPNGHNRKGMAAEDFQMWMMSGESCPEGTIPIRRTTEGDMLRASSVASFGKKPTRLVRRDSTSDGHESQGFEKRLQLSANRVKHAVGYVSGDEYYGAKANINVWAPRVSNQYEFSLSQLWVISGSFGDDLNTIEAGWQVSPELYGDYYPRFFTYWTSDAYQATGCYNLLCSGFVQTNNRIAIGAAISPTSSYGGGQFDISLLVWKVNLVPPPNYYTNKMFTNL